MKLFPLRSTSTREQVKEETNQSLLFLNVYDLTPVNNYLYWFGLGIFHSGIEVHGMEYAFGAHDYPSSGIFEVEPRSCPGFRFRQSVVLGKTNISNEEFRSFIQKISRKFHGDTYHLIAKNCNHFTEEVSKQLVGKHIPWWVNRLARLGSFLNCLLPQSMRITASVRHPPDHPADTDDDDGVESFELSFVDSEEDDQEKYLLGLKKSNSDVAFVEEKPVRLARELM